MVMVGGRAVHVVVRGRDRGTAPDLVLIHGASGNLREFDELSARLGDRFRLIAVDRPGLGHSDGLDLADIGLAAQARHLAAAVQAVGAHRPILIGHSYGGSVALNWALQGLLDPAGLMLISAPSLPWPGDLDRWYQLTRTGFGQSYGIPAVAGFVPLAVLRKSVRQVFAPEPVPQGYFEAKGIALAIRRQTLRHNTGQINRLAADLRDQMGDYPNLTLPVELLHGQVDGVVPHHIHSQPLAKLLPNARLTELPGTGHMPHLTRITDVQTALDRLVQRAALQLTPE